jgi:hypothetical protein
MLISVHVPKCAGTSFRQVLDSLFGAQVWFNYGAIFTQEQARAELVPPGARVIHGHFLADAFDRVIPERRLLTWVRHPVERVVSNYQHFLRSPDMRDDCCRALHERKLSLRGFADLDWMRNLTTRYLAGKPVEDFEFIGITDCFPQSVDRFCRTFGYRRPRQLPCENVNPGRTSELYDISPGDRAFILERNRADLAWYHRAAERMALAGAEGTQRIV